MGAPRVAHQVVERDASASFLGRPEERPPPGSVEVPADSEVRSAIEAFLRAARDGDLESLVAVLDPDVVWRSDGGGQLPAPRRPIRGAAEVAGMVLRQAPPYVRHARIVTVNGTPGVAVAAGDEVCSESSGLR